MSILADVQSPTPGALLLLYEVDFSTTGLPVTPPNMHLYSGVATNYGDVIFGSTSYSPFPMEIKGLKKTSEGPLPRPVLTISNVQGVISSQLIQYNDFIGARVSIIKTFAKYLDGQPAADPTARRTEVYYIEQKKSETNQVVQLQLSSPIDILDAKLPSRAMLVNTCPWEYKGADCSWPGTDPNLYFDASDDPVTSQADDTCGKRLTSCKRRFCGYDGTKYVTPNANLPYGAFPALGRTK